MSAANGENDSTAGGNTRVPAKGLSGEFGFDVVAQFAELGSISAAKAPATTAFVLVVEVAVVPIAAHAPLPQPAT